MDIPSIDKYINLEAKTIDTTGYLAAVEIELAKYGLKNKSRMAYAFAVIELWKKATKVDWVKPYADIVALKPYITILEELEKKINGEKKNGNQDNNNDNL